MLSPAMLSGRSTSSLPTLFYRPTDWYWIIGADTQNVWSSARAMLVPIADVDYVAWSDPGRRPTNVAAMKDIEDTLAQVFPRGTPKTYAADCRYRKASGGLTITSISPVSFLTDPTARNTLARASDYAQAVPHTTDWKMSDGSFVQLSEAQLVSATNAIASFVQSCFTCESQMVAGIDGGTITTLDQIDTAFAAIPNSVTG
jgi:Domain of unknown function (DUF4376)